MTIYYIYNDQHNTTQHNTKGHAMDVENVKIESKNGKWVIVVEMEKGEILEHRHQFDSKESAGKTASKIWACRQIDERFWKWIGSVPGSWDEEKRGILRAQKTARMNQTLNLMVVRKTNAIFFHPDHFGLKIQEAKIQAEEYFKKNSKEISLVCLIFGAGEAGIVSRYNGISWEN